MRWREQDGVRWLETDLPGARAAFSTRLGGVSQGSFKSLNLGRLTGDRPDAVRENRYRLAAAVAIDPELVLIGRQVHGAHVARHDQPTEPRAFANPVPGLPEADGQATARAGLAPLVFVADCLPVALAGPGGVAMIHCGWRGLAAGIVERGVEEVEARAAAVGPGIGPCCYEVGDEVLGRLRAAGVRTSPRAGCSTCAKRPGACWSGPGWRRWKSPRSARAVSRSSSSRTVATESEPAAKQGSSGLATQSRNDVAMPGLIRGLEAERVRANLERVRERAGPQVEILAATKYVPLDEMGVLAEAGVTLVGENRLQDLEAKRERWGDAFAWDFIGNLQSRKVKRILPLVRLIHSVATDSVLTQLDRHARPETEVLVEVNVAGEESKGGIQPAELGEFIDRCPVRVVGLMTMPPFSTDPEASRPAFARLAELAAEHGLERLSMGTSQDWEVAIEEGATILRLGTALYG